MSPLRSVHPSMQDRPSSLAPLVLATAVGAAFGLIGGWSSGLPLAIMAASGGASLAVACVVAFSFLG